MLSIKKKRSLCIIFLANDQIGARCYKKIGINIVFKKKKDARESDKNEAIHPISTKPQSVTVELNQQFKRQPRPATSTDAPDILFHKLNH